MGYQQNVPLIPMPTPAALTKLAAQAAIGNTSFTGYSSGSTGEARTRVEFVAVDLNADGDTTDDDEGFVRVYQAASGNEDYNVAKRYSSLDNSGNGTVATDLPPTRATHHQHSGLHNRERRVDCSCSSQTMPAIAATTPPTTPASAASSEATRR